jgi:hypothetical protein
MRRRILFTGGSGVLSTIAAGAFGDVAALFTGLDAAGVDPVVALAGGC